MSPRILGAIYAGGQSLRFERDKTTALYKGRTFLDHVITAMVAQVDTLVLLGGTAKPPWLVLDDATADTGPLGGLKTAMRYARAFGYDWVATAPCDTPCLPLQYVTKMLHKASPAIQVVVAETTLGWQPTVALWRVTEAAAAPYTIKQGFSLTAAIKRATPFASVHFSAAHLLNINDQPALAKLRRRAHLN